MRAIYFESAQALLRYAHRRLSGKKVYELVQAHYPEKDFSAWKLWQKEKGVVGQMVDDLLYVPERGAEIDFPTLGVEVKTLPLTLDFLPAESTFIATAPLRLLQTERWEESLIYRKVRRILWIPFQKLSMKNFKKSCFSAPLLWEPGQATQRTLQSDWETLAHQLMMGKSAKISALMGEVLQLRSKAKNRQVRTLAYDEYGVFQKLRPKAYYFRRKAMIELLKEPLKQCRSEARAFEEFKDYQ